MYGEGNGTPLQCSCLENPRDGEAWWVAVYGVAQSRTRLKWLSSSIMYVLLNLLFLHLLLSVCSVEAGIFVTCSPAESFINICSLNSEYPRIEIWGNQYFFNVHLFKSLYLLWTFPHFQILSQGFSERLAAISIVFSVRSFILGQWLWFSFT